MFVENYNYLDPDFHTCQAYQWQPGNVKDEIEPTLSTKPPKTLSQKLIKCIKNCCLWLPVVITTTIIEKYLFPRKLEYSNSKRMDYRWDLGCTSYEEIPDPIKTFPYYLETNDATTSIKYGRLRWSQNTKPKNLIIYFSGNGQTLRDFYGLAQNHVDESTTFLMVDLPKHGFSRGDLDHKTILKQADLAYQFAIKHLGFKEEQVVLKGVSLGCFQALSLAKKYPKISRLDLDAPFSNMEDISRATTFKQSPNWILRIMGYLMKKAIRRYYNFNNIKDIEQLKRFTGKINIQRRTQDRLTSLDENNFAKSCLTNQVVKRIVEIRLGHLLTNSSVEEKERWMDEYLSTEHLTHSLVVDDDDHAKVIQSLQELLVDKAVNISDKKI